MKTIFKYPNFKYPNQLPAAPHKVQVLHKKETLPNGATGDLAVGKTFQFRSGSRLTVLGTGQVVNPDKRRRKRKIGVG